MSRHRKFVKSEKAKTKLKAAKLPKGLNVTKTDFKIKKIVIREQIRDTSLIQNGTTIRSSNIKELLSKLQHHNATNRNEGLRYLNELVTNHPIEASNHLGPILQGICQLSLDIEKDVRRECFKALNLVFGTQESEIIAPFFNAIVSYLRCAMTHINRQIQEDSLFMLDCLLMFTPTLVAAHSDAIFSAFLDMISKLRVESKPDRTLSMHLGSQLTSVKWRSKALERLLGILNAIVAAKKTDKQIDGKLSRDVNGEVDDAFKLPNYQRNLTNNNIYQNYNPDKTFRCSMIRRNLNKNCELANIFQKSLTSSASAANIIEERNESQRIIKQTDLLMPLLFETWMEVRPIKLNKHSIEDDGDDIQITNEAAMTLKTIIDIVDRLVELMKICDIDEGNTDSIDWFRQMYGHQFCGQFLIGFPYSQCDGFKGSKRKSKGNATEQDVYEAGGQKCFQQNFGIAYLFANINSNLTIKYKNEATNILKFIENNLLAAESQPNEVSTNLIKFLQIVFIENSKKWTQIVPNVTELLAMIVSLDENGKFTKEMRSKMFNFICDVITNRNINSIQISFDSWLARLPKMLTQQFINLNALKTFERLAKMNNKIFLDNLQNTIPAIIENLSKIQITGTANQEQAKQMILNLFFWLKIKTINFDKYTNQLEEIKYVKEIISLRAIS